MPSLSKKSDQSHAVNFALVGIVFVAALTLVYVGVSFLYNSQADAPSEFYSVQMIGGDVYFGKMSWFPSPRLTNAWALQRTVNQTTGQAELGVVPVSRVFWSPVDELYLNPQNIITWMRLRNDSDLVKAMRDPSQVAPSNSQGGGFSPSPSEMPNLPSAPTGTTGFQGPGTEPPNQ